MKNAHLIMSLLQPASIIHANRDEWQMTHVTEPRPSCVEKWKVRDALRRLEPKQVDYINGVFVKRTGHAKDARYLIGDATMTFNEAIRELEMTIKVPKPKEAKQGELRQLSLFEVQS